MKFHFSLRLSKSSPFLSHSCAAQAWSPVKTFGVASLGGGQKRIRPLIAGSTVTSRRRRKGGEKPCAIPDELFSDEQPNRQELNLREKFAEVRRRLGYIQKRGHNERHNYSYVTAADLAGSVGDILAELGMRAVRCDWELLLAMLIAAMAWKRPLRAI